MINNVNKYPISQLIDPESSLVFEIPKYQREYTWASKQWEALFEDLIDNDKGYFLGSIICIDIATDPINSPKREVVDGQQRLMTLSILFAAVYDALYRYRDSLDDNQRYYLVQLKRKLALMQNEDQTRVVPQLQNNNFGDYRSLLSELGIISKQLKPKLASSRRIYKAFNFFKQRIGEHCDEAGDDVAALFSLLDKINAAVIVMIEVSNHADAYTLFESLNHRGTPLTVVDLIKNLLLARLDDSATGSIDFYFDQWTQVLTHIGDDYAVQERFFRHYYNAFRGSINAVFRSVDASRKNDRATYPLGSIATRANLLSIYERIIKDDPKAFIEQLLEHSMLYSQLLLKNEEKAGSILRPVYLSLNRIQGAPSYLLLLYILKNAVILEVSDHIVHRICTLLVSFFVRRNLTDVPGTRNLTRIFMGLVEEIEECLYKGDELYRFIREKLIAQSASDELFREKLNGSVYSDNSGATRFILSAMAEKSMTLENQVDLWTYHNSLHYIWTIEHILPQGDRLPEHWVAMIADGDSELAKEYQMRYGHTLGNLTITAYNSSLGNRSFDEKKERVDSNGNFIGYRNGLSLNDDVVGENRWTIDAIQARTERMVATIMDLFTL